MDVLILAFDADKCSFSAFSALSICHRSCPFSFRLYWSTLLQHWHVLTQSLCNQSHCASFEVSAGSFKSALCAAARCYIEKANITLCLYLFMRASQFVFLFILSNRALYHCDVIKADIIFQFMSVYASIGIILTCLCYRPFHSHEHIALCWFAHPHFSLLSYQ